MYLFLYQVEYSYPPLIPGRPVNSSECPEEWKHLPSLALPDGAHNYTEGRYTRVTFVQIDLHFVYSAYSVTKSHLLVRNHTTLKLYPVSPG